MSRLIRTELLKATTTRTSVLVVVAATAFAGFLGFATAALAGREGNPPLGSADMVERVVGVSTIPAAVALLLGVLLSAGEHQHGTVTTTFLVTPERWRVVLAKAGAAAIVGPVVTVLLVVASVAGAVPRLLDDGAAVDLDAAGAGSVVGGLVLAAALLGALGALLGLLVRSQVAAVVGVAAWALVVEGVLDTIAGGGLREWMPGGAAASLAGGGEQAAAVAAAVLVVWTVAVGAVAAPAVQRRDVV